MLERPSSGSRRCVRGRRALFALLISLLLALPGVAPLAAQTAPEAPGRPDLYDHADDLHADGLTHLEAWQPVEFAQSALPRNCDDLWRQLGDDVGFVLSDAELLADGDGEHFCLFWDYRWESYDAWLLNQRSLQGFRSTKAQLQPLLPAAGVDPCLVAQWSTPAAVIERALTLNDRLDAGQWCEPRVFSHGAVSERRANDVYTFISEVALAGERVFGWSLTWPLRVHLYDDHDAFIEGARLEGGDPRVTRQSLENTYGLARSLSNGMRGFLVDTARFPEPLDLQMLVAHEYAHIAQTGVLGCTCYLPYFAMEGGAEYFASLVVGADQKDLVARLTRAMQDERDGRGVPLREMIQPPPAQDSRRTDGAYSRGYAAMRLLTARWGAESFRVLHGENVGGTPERFVAGITRLTGLTLDQLNRELGASLRGPLSSVATYRTLPDGAEPAASRFAPTDRVVTVLLTWNCLDTPVAAEVRIIAPNGQRAQTFDGTTGTGCNVRSLVDFALDSGVSGRIAREQPGNWRVEVVIEGAVQGAATFVVQR